MENNEKLYIGGLLVLAMILTGSVTYYVADTGEEVTCRTGNGWEILEDHGDYFKAVCQYKTKDWTYALCSDFRATSSYPRYGCNVVTLIEKETEIINNNDGSNTGNTNDYNTDTTSKRSVCTYEGCVAI